MENENCFCRQSYPVSFFIYHIAQLTDAANFAQVDLSVLCCEFLPMSAKHNASGAFLMQSRGVF